MTPHRTRAAAAILLAAVACTPAARANPGRGGPPAAVVTPATAQPAPALHVSGTHIVDTSGAAVQLNGVNRSGTEYACAQGWGIFDGPSDQASVTAIASWHVHVIRVSLNEDCWLGINGVNAAYAGSNYRKAVADYVHLLESNGMNAIVELHISAPGQQLALGQQKMPDADHSPPFWRSVARTFGKDQAVLFDLFNEPHDVSWACWRNGCTVDGWHAAGMQRLVNVVRKAGSTNVLMLGGVGWSGDLTHWHANMPTDPQGNLAAAWHVYDFTGCPNVSCWNANLAGVAGAVPVILGEFGETDCAHGFVDRLMTWADGLGLGYVAWTWDAWPSCTGGPTLVTNYAGTPTGFGVGVRDHYVARFPAP